MTNIIKMNLTILASVLLIVPFISFAQVGVGVDVGADLEVDADVSTTTDIDIDTGIDAGVDSDLEVEVGTEMETEAETDTETTSETETSLRVNSLGIAVTSSAQVESEEDLEVFSANASVRNRSVANVAISSDSELENRVSVTYNHRARFLGLVPVTIRSTTEVEARADGEAEVRSRLPWWSFMVRGAGDIRSNVESRISNNSEVMANARLDASASARARVAEAIIAELEAYAGVEADASIEN